MIWSMNLNVDKNSEEKTAMQIEDGVKSGWSWDTKKLVKDNLLSNVRKNTGLILKKKVSKVRDVFKCLAMDK